MSNKNNMWNPQMVHSGTLTLAQSRAGSFVQGPEKNPDLMAFSQGPWASQYFSHHGSSAEEADEAEGESSPTFAEPSKRRSSVGLFQPTPETPESKELAFDGPPTPPASAPPRRRSSDQIDPLIQLTLASDRPRGLGGPVSKERRLSKGGIFPEPPPPPPKVSPKERRLTPEPFQSQPQRQRRLSISDPRVVPSVDRRSSNGIFPEPPPPKLSSSASQRRPSIRDPPTAPSASEQRRRRSSGEIFFSGSMVLSAPSVNVTAPEPPPTRKLSTASLRRHSSNLSVSMTFYVDSDEEIARRSFLVHEVDEFNLFLKATADVIAAEIQREKSLEDMEGHGRRGLVVAEGAGRKGFYIAAMEGEAVARRLMKWNYVLRTVCVEGDVVGRRDIDAAEVTARNALKVWRRADVETIENEFMRLHAVCLHDGCPFVHAQDCPYFTKSWVSKESFRSSHRQTPRAAGERLPYTRAAYLNYERIRAARWFAMMRPVRMQKKAEIAEIAAAPSK